MEWRGAPFPSLEMESPRDHHMIPRNTIRPMMTIFMLCCVIGFASEAVSADRGSPADLIGGKTSARDRGPIFDLLDENGDQRVDRAEFRVGIVSVFDMLDRNSDNALSNAELPSIMSFEFNKADHNNNGRLSVFEFIDSEFMKFTTFDQNNDGFVTYE